jgi:hypothetical protein
MYKILVNREEKVKRGKAFLFRQMGLWQAEMGEHKSMVDFAEYLDMPYDSVKQWMGGFQSIPDKHLAKLSEKLGPEIYEVLGVKPPGKFRSLATRIVTAIAEDLDPEDQEDFLRMIQGFYTDKSARKADKGNGEAEHKASTV